MTTLMTASVISNSPSTLSLITPGTRCANVDSERGVSLTQRPIRPSWPMSQRTASESGTFACVPHLTPTGPVLQPTNGKPVKPRRQAPRASSAHALAMLTRQPVCSADVPRFHVEPRVVDGTLRVDDRASGDQFKVYTPRFASQFLAGHRAGLWYLRPARDVGAAPRSLGFTSARDAVEALRTACWSSTARAVDRRHARCRVIWS
jgi:hypothetical protein